METLSDLLNQIEEKKKELERLPKSPENERRLWEKLRLEWNYNSNHIEGNTLTYGETKLLIIFGKTSGNHSFREYSEMKAHDVAVRMVVEFAQEHDRPITETDIRLLNKTILVESFWKEAITSDGQATRKEIVPGQYKTSPNNVLLKTGETFFFASPEETPAQMHDLINWYREAENQFPIPVVAAEFHYRFVRVHPFDDGNGRVARLLANYILLKAGYPPVVIFSADKENYLDALARTDTGDGLAFQIYFAKQVVASLDLAIRARRGEDISDKEDLNKRIEILHRELSFEERKKQSREETRLNHIRNFIRTDFFVWLKLVVKQFSVLEKFFNQIVFTIHKNHRELASFENSYNDDDLFNLLLQELNKGGGFRIIISVQFDGFKFLNLKIFRLIKITIGFFEQEYLISPPNPKKNMHFVKKQYSTPITQEDSKLLSDIIDKLLLDIETSIAEIK